MKKNIGVASYNIQMFHRKIDLEKQFNWSPNKIFDDILK
jgi:hypothetical protein